MGDSLTGGVTRMYAYDSNKRLVSVMENGATQSISESIDIGLRG